MEFNRLRWACRRGMLELDLVLLPFVENHYQALDTELQQSFIQLLECEDQDLFAWFLHRQNPEDEALQPIVNLIREKTGVPSGNATS